MILQPAARATAPDPGNLVGIQALRAMAALMVVAYHGIEAANLHTTDAAPIAWENGSAGVDIFFVISGLVMTISSRRLLGTRAGWRTFMALRLTRIVPLYWLFSALKIIAVLAVPSLALRTRLSVGYVASSMLFLPVHDIFGQFKPLLPVGWTLTFEMLFYLMFAAGLALRMPSPIVLIPLLVALPLVPHPDGSILGELCNPIMMEFAFGIVVGSLLIRGLVLPPLAAAAVLIVATAVIVLVPASGPGGRILAWGVPACAIVTALVGLEPVIGRRIPAILRLLGDASYAIYLSHGFVIAALAVILRRVPWPAQDGVLWIVASLLVSSLVGVATHLLVERPLLGVIRRRRPRVRFA